MLGRVVWVGDGAGALAVSGARGTSGMTLLFPPDSGILESMLFAIGTILFAVFWREILGIPRR